MTYSFLLVDDGKGQQILHVPWNLQFMIYFFSKPTLVSHSSDNVSLLLILLTVIFL